MGWFRVVRGHSRALETVPFETAHTGSYSPLIVTMSLCCTVSAT